MIKNKKESEICCECKPRRVTGAGADVYGLGFIGAAIYYVSTAMIFWMGVFGIIKAVVWPAFLVYEALKFFGA